jgi:transposase
MVTRVENFEQLYREQTVRDNVLTAENFGLKTQCNNLIAEISRLKEQFEWLKRQMFGQKSERFIDTPTKDELLPGFEIPAFITEIITTPIPAHTRKVTTSGKDKFKVEIPEDLPREKEYKDIPEEKKTDPKTGAKLTKIGEEVVEKLAYRPGQYFVKQLVYPKYASKENPLFGVKQSPVEDCVITGSKFDSSFMAHVVTEKFGYHMPLYRINEKLSLQGIRITEQTLCGLVIRLGQEMQVLFDEMKKRLFEQGVVFTDDTPVDLVGTGTGKAKTARMWGCIGNLPNAPPYHLYEFSSDRCERHPMAFFKDFKGILHADAYSAYEKMDESDDYALTWSACWSHARRKFENSQYGDEKFRLKILRKMRHLFMYERFAWAKKPEERLRIREEKEKPVVDEIYKMLRDKVKDSTLLPKSSIAEAIGYMLSREKNFRVYLSEPYARMENNTAERGVRKLVIGRKNWLFVGSPRSGKAMANLLSLVQSCRAMGIDPQVYLEDIFKRLPAWPHKNLAELLPDQWSKNFGKQN